MTVGLVLLVEEEEEEEEEVEEGGFCCCWRDLIMICLEASWTSSTVMGCVWKRVARLLLREAAEAVAGGGRGRRWRELRGDFCCCMSKSRTLSAKVRWQGSGGRQDPESRERKKVI